MIKKRHLLLVCLPLIFISCALAQNYCRYQDYHSLRARLYSRPGQMEEGHVREVCFIERLLFDILEELKLPPESLKDAELRIFATDLVLQTPERYTNLRSLELFDGLTIKYGDIIFFPPVKK